MVKLADPSAASERKQRGSSELERYRLSSTHLGCNNSNEEEATKQLSKETRENNSHIPWCDIAGMRDKLTHHYFGVDMEEVWLTAKDDLPTLKREVEMILKAFTE